jgi:hypothetical protein
MSIVKATELAGAGDYPANRLNQRERKVLQVAEQYAPAASSDWATAPDSIGDALDALAASNSGGKLKTASVVYDFSVNGGTAGNINLALTLPDNAIIAEVIRDELTACTSAGSTATITLNVPTDGNLEQTGLTADGGSPSLASSGGTSVPKKLTASRVARVTIANENVTAGKIEYFIRYYQGQ